MKFGQMAKKKYNYDWIDRLVPGDILRTRSGKYRAIMQIIAVAEVVEIIGLRCILSSARGLEVVIHFFLDFDSFATLVAQPD